MMHDVESKLKVLVVGDIAQSSVCCCHQAAGCCYLDEESSSCFACQLGTATLRYISNRGGNNDINETNNQVKSQDSPSAMGCCNP